MLSDGSMAWKVKDYLVSLVTCASVTIEGKDYEGKGGGGGEKEEKDGDNVEKKKKNEDNEKKEKKMEL